MRGFGWWHIECNRCGWYPFEDYGVADDRYISRVYGWNTRNEAIQAWETATKGDIILVDAEWEAEQQSDASQPTGSDSKSDLPPSQVSFQREEVIHLASLSKAAPDTQVFAAIEDALSRRYERRASKFDYRVIRFKDTT